MIKTGIDYTKILFFDVETVHGSEKLFKAETSLATAWGHICESKYKEESDDFGMLYKKYAALYPEFGKVVCFSMGYFTNEKDFTVKAYYSDNEKALLDEFSKVITKNLTGNVKFLGGHNIKRFDIPYMMRRAIIQDVYLPTIFDTYLKKPWELNDYVDTLEVWQCGTIGLGSSTLESIAASFGMKSPKEEMSGDMVSTVYYMPSGPDFKRIGKYCNFDTITSAAVYMKMSKGHYNMKVIENIY